MLITRCRAIGQPSITALCEQAPNSCIDTCPASLVEHKKSGDVWIHFHTSPDDFSSQKLSPLCNFLYEYICNKAPHLHVFSLFSTHFKWSKLGLKQNCEASLSPINQDFLESCQYIAVADE